MRASVSDFLAALVAALLYWGNRLSLFEGLLPQAFLLCHFNDVCCGIFFPAVVNVILGVFRWDERITRALPSMAINLMGSFVWEGVAPAVLADSTADALDVLAYCIGGLLFAALRAVLVRAIPERG